MPSESGITAGLEYRPIPLMTKVTSLLGLKLMKKHGQAVKAIMVAHVPLRDLICGKGTGITFGLEQDRAKSAN